MNKRAKNRLSFIFIIVILAIATCLVFISIKPTKISCISHHTLNHAGDKIVADYVFYFNDNKGAIKVNGMAYADKKELMINRQIMFDYQHSDENYILSSSDIHVLSGDTLDSSEIKQHFPPFFWQSGKQFSMITGTHNNDFIFQFGRVPVFYCKSKQR